VIIPGIGRIEAGPELFDPPDSSFQYAHAIAQHVQAGRITVGVSKPDANRRKIGVGMLHVAAEPEPAQAVQVLIDL
jgi:hypothetical protein